jgi:translation elongation factor P/translation initiation factor 5A
MVRKSTRKASRKTARKTRKLSKGASEWNKLVMKHFHDGRKKSKTYSLKDAIKAAKREKDARK